jgi:ATP adenylyltransferase
MMYPFPAGGLRVRLAEVAAAARRSGALQAIPTRCEYVEDQGVEFLVRIVSRQAGKRLVARTPATACNPFLPWEPALYVADVTLSHVCLLNKFPIVDEHLLIVTREFQEQTSRLTDADLEAVWRCLCEFDSLGFYNSGRKAGASQPHRHLQLVPLAPHAERPPFPLLARLPARPPGRPERLEVLPFEHRIVRLPPDPLGGNGVSRLADAYASLVDSLGLSSSDGLGPYNLLLTRSWMFMVPRTAECFHEISLNALAFAGALLAKNSGERALLRKFGPIAALRAVSQ